MDEGSLRELLAVDERRAIKFFAMGLIDVSEAGVDPDELLYNASILAHCALVSTEAQTDFPTPKHLECVLDTFVLDDSMHRDGFMMETAASHCLLLTGFFEDQMRTTRRSVRWYASLGSSFFHRAAIFSPPERFNRLNGMAERFEIWRRRWSRLNRELRDGPYLLRL